MVYCGKPSAACERCRHRRLKVRLNYTARMETRAFETLVTFRETNSTLLSLIKGSVELVLQNLRANLQGL